MVSSFVVVPPHKDSFTTTHRNNTSEAIKRWKPQRGVRCVQVLCDVCKHRHSHTLSSYTSPSQSLIMHNKFYPNICTTVRAQQTYCLINSRVHLFLSPWSRHSLWVVLGSQWRRLLHPYIYLRLILIWIVIVFRRNQPPVYFVTFPSEFSF